ncbi:MAG: HypC/HybG/HupF family hydrogenase formation chaperone [Candidatus Aminicenantes bacterium]|nr:HypC/HybG/HupF family hydrogenase formation chaperone [Candidatus Aminicenantes bacterium]
MSIIEIDGDMGVVEHNGVKRKVGLMLLDAPCLGDWVLIHAGFAISKLHPQEAEETLSLLKEADLLE